MAIIGATTMDFDFFKSIGLSDKIWNNGPLNTQIQWFRQLLPSACGKGTSSTGLIYLCTYFIISSNQ
jgi:hypothetical protein